MENPVFNKLSLNGKNKKKIHIYSFSIRIVTFFLTTSQRVLKKRTRWSYVSGDFFSRGDEISDVNNFEFQVVLNVSHFKIDNLVLLMINRNYSHKSV